MGISISWLAVKGKEDEAILRELGLAPTGERDELPAESRIGAAALDGGWYAIVFDRCDHELLRDEVLKRLSEGCELLAAAAEEHVMYSSAAGWRNGERTWWCEHDAQAGLYDLEAEGSLPGGFDALRRQRLDQQDAERSSLPRRGLTSLFRRRTEGVDHVFDIPLEAAKLVTGFSYDESDPEEGFAVLRVAPDRRERRLGGDYR